MCASAYINNQLLQLLQEHIMHLAPRTSFHVTPLRKSPRPFFPSLPIVRQKVVIKCAITCASFRHFSLMMLMTVVENNNALFFKARPALAQISMKRCDLRTLVADNKRVRKQVEKNHYSRIFQSCWIAAEFFSQFYQNRVKYLIF